jgi:hypothetical protein
VAGSRGWRAALKGRLKARDLGERERALLLSVACQLLSDPHAAAALLLSAQQCRLWLGWAAAGHAREGAAGQRWSLRLLCQLLLPRERREELLPAHEPHDMARGEPGAAVVGALARASRLLARVLTRCGPRPAQLPPPLPLGLLPPPPPPGPPPGLPLALATLRAARPGEGRR